MIDEKNKLDIPAKKAQLVADQQNLEALSRQLQSVLSLFTAQKAEEINKLLTDILEKQKITTVTGVQSFNDGILATVGSVEWKALINAAKVLYDAEVAIR